MWVLKRKKKAEKEKKEEREGRERVGQRVMTYVLCFALKMGSTRALSLKMGSKMPGFKRPPP